MTITPNKRFKNICVLSGFNYNKYKEFVETAIKLHLVYGGGDQGLSKLVSKATYVRAIQVLSIIPRTVKPLGCLSNSPTREEIVVSSMRE